MCQRTWSAHLEERRGWLLPDVTFFWDDLYSAFQQRYARTYMTTDYGGYYRPRPVVLNFSTSPGPASEQA